MKTITLEARDKNNRMQAESIWQITTKWIDILDRRIRWYKLIGGFGYDFGNLTGVRKLPVGEPHGIINYQWPMHWSERKENQ